MVLCINFFLFLFQLLCLFCTCTRVLVGGEEQIIWKCTLQRVGMRCTIYLSWKYAFASNFIICWAPILFVLCFPNEALSHYHFIWRKQQKISMTYLFILLNNMYIPRENSLYNLKHVTNWLKILSKSPWMVMLYNFESLNFGNDKLEFQLTVFLISLSKSQRHSIFSFK